MLAFNDWTVPSQTSKSSISSFNSISKRFFITSAVLVDTVLHLPSIVANYKVVSGNVFRFMLNLFVFVPLKILSFSIGIFMFASTLNH